MEKYDLIVIDFDHSLSDPLGEKKHAFYTANGLAAAKQHLSNRGGLAVWSYAESSELSKALEKTFETIHLQPITTFNSLVNQGQTDWLFYGAK